MFGLDIIPLRHKYLFKGSHLLNLFVLVHWHGIYPDDHDIIMKFESTETFPIHLGPRQKRIPEWNSKPLTDFLDKGVVGDHEQST